MRFNLAFEGLNVQARDMKINHNDSSKRRNSPEEFDPNDEVPAKF